MYTKFMALLVAGVALSGCCLSGTGCNAPVAGAPIAWDGLGEAPTENSAEPAGEVKRPKRRTARNQEIIVGPLNNAPPRAETKARYDEWTRHAQRRSGSRREARAANQDLPELLIRTSRAPFAARTTPSVNERARKAPSYAPAGGRATVERNIASSS